MYEHAMKREHDLLKFHAVMHGAKIKETKKEAKEHFIFGDPNKDYNHLTPDERQELTDRMKGVYMQRLGKTPLGKR